MKFFSELSSRKIAFIGGLSIVALAIVAGFAYGFVFERLVVSGNATLTASNIKDSNLLFHISILGWLAVIILDILVAWVLYALFKPVHKNFSLLAGCLRLTYTAILGIALLNIIIASVLLSGAGYLLVFDPNQLNALALLFLNTFDKMFSLGLVIFAFHLLVLAYLVFKSHSIPKILAIFLFLAFLGYLATSLTDIFLPNHTAYKNLVDTAFIGPMIIGELGLGLWLLFKFKSVKE